MEIRRARLDDGPGIALVHVRSWQTTYQGIIPQAYLDGLDVEKRAAWWGNLLQQAEALRHSNWVAVDETDGVVGFANGGPPQVTEEGYTSELYAIYLLQSAQGQGIGRQLVERVAQDLWDAGHRTMLVGVLAENPSRLFYERLGAKLLRAVPLERGGKALIERYYGWADLSVLLP